MLKQTASFLTLHRIARNLEEFGFLILSTIMILCSSGLVCRSFLSVVNLFVSLTLPCCSRYRKFSTISSAVSMSSVGLKKSSRQHLQDVRIIFNFVVGASSECSNSARRNTFGSKNESCSRKLQVLQVLGGSKDFFCLRN